MFFLNYNLTYLLFLSKVEIGFYSLKQKIAFQLELDYHNGLRSASDTKSITFRPGPSLKNQLVTKDTIDQLVSHALANRAEGWRFLKFFVKYVDEYIKQLENLVAE